MLALALALAPAVPAGAAEDGTVYLAAGLRGANEVGVAGDPDGLATVVLRISGDEVAFAARWEGVGAPVDVQVAAGARGEPGADRLRLLGGPLPGSVRGVTGVVRAAPDLVAALLTDPAGHHADLRDAAHPRGAVRGRFHRLARPVDLNGVLNGPDQATLSARTPAPAPATTSGATTSGATASGATAEGTAAGDGQAAEAGQAVWWLRPGGAGVAYAAHWSGLTGPVTGGLVAREGVTRPAETTPTATTEAAGVTLFTGALPENVTGVAGVAPVAPGVARRLAADPARYAAVLRTAAGALVRARLSAGAEAHPRALTAPVLRGEQVYACTQQPSGAYALTQLGVAARLRRGVDHSYVTPAAGPPQWVAPDGSAVRGAVVTRTPNGDGVIPELVLDATQAGAPAGLLARATEILRLNTTGGAAPPGPCAPGAEVRVPYGADYVFLS
ncbi:DUF3455 domain-containing protein [Actinomadura luzonensis]|uniref:DUF3455 domain-containing protein n=1 Tax=Actinomadura luzonensis TaxID=2805427 RepID=UPI001F5966F6|nr:DUF3455 domain-containing protein [Actinomadura luzonensis]